MLLQQHSKCWMFDNIAGIVHFSIAGNANNSMSIADDTVPQQFAHTGIWDWMNLNGTVDPKDATQLDFDAYNAPKGGENLLGHIGRQTLLCRCFGQILLKSGFRLLPIWRSDVDIASLLFKS